MIRILFVDEEANVGAITRIRSLDVYLNDPVECAAMLKRIQLVLAAAREMKAELVEEVADVSDSEYQA